MNDYVKTMRKSIGHDCLLLVGAGVTPVREGKMLLQKRRDNGCWAVNGGAVELDETVEGAARRELYEETGLTAGELEFFGVYSGPGMRFSYPNGDEAYVIAIEYLCRDFSGEPLTETGETVDLRWFEPQALPENINPPDVRMLNDIAAYLLNKAGE